MYHQQAVVCWCRPRGHAAPSLNSIEKGWGAVTSFRVFSDWQILLSTRLAKAATAVYGFWARRSQASSLSRRLVAYAYPTPAVAGDAGDASLSPGAAAAFAGGTTADAAVTAAGAFGGLSEMACAIAAAFASAGPSHGAPGAAVSPPPDPGAHVFGA